MSLGSRRENVEKRGLQGTIFGLEKGSLAWGAGDRQDTRRQSGEENWVRK